MTIEDLKDYFTLEELFYEVLAALSSSEDEAIAEHIAKCNDIEIQDNSDQLQIEF